MQLLYQSRVTRATKHDLSSLERVLSPNYAEFMSTSHGKSQFVVHEIGWLGVKWELDIFSITIWILKVWYAEWWLVSAVDNFNQPPSWNLVFSLNKSQWSKERGSIMQNFTLCPPVEFCIKTDKWKIHYVTFHLTSMIIILYMSVFCRDLFTSHNFLFPRASNLWHVALCVSSLEFKKTKPSIFVNMPNFVDSVAPERKKTQLCM